MSPVLMARVFKI